jgi:hypothetical protein
MQHAGFSKLTYLKNLRGHQMSSGAYRVLVALFNYTDASGRHAYPGERRLADDTAIKERTVRAHLKWLTDNGYLIKGARGHGGGGRGHGIATVYAVALPAEHPLSTGEITSNNRQDDFDLPVPARPLSDPLTPDPVSDPLQQSARFGEETLVPDTDWETQLREELGD